MQINLDYLQSTGGAGGGGGVGQPAPSIISEKGDDSIGVAMIQEKVGHKFAAGGGFPYDV